MTQLALLLQPRAKGEAAANACAIEWRQVRGFEHYEVSNMGDVRSIRKGLLLAKGFRGNYQYVGFWRKDKQTRLAVHRLVLMAFDPRARPEELQGNHKNGIKYDNRLANLEWVTPAQNAWHSTHVLGNLPPKSPSGALAWNRRAVVKITADGLERYECISDAVRRGYRADCIVDVCRGTQKTHAGFRWAYV